MLSFSQIKVHYLSGIIFIFQRALGNGYGIDNSTQKGRKLKQYVLEEKLDIIDYAKVCHA